MNANQLQPRAFRKNYEGPSHDPYRNSKLRLGSSSLASSSQHNPGMISHTLFHKVFIYRNSILSEELLQEMDAIVNPTNERLWASGAGVANLIYSRAGYTELQQACNDITARVENHSIPSGQTVITESFNLQLPWILHTVAPYTQHHEDLISCYCSLLDLCVVKGIRSVAIPCIGTGEGSFCKDVACSIALRAVRNWLLDAMHIGYSDFLQQIQLQPWHHNVNIEYDAQCFLHCNDKVADRIQNIVFCCFDEDNFTLYRTSIASVFPCASQQNHSYLWTERKQNLVHKHQLQQLENHIQSLQIENMNLKKSAQVSVHPQVDKQQQQLVYNQAKQVAAQRIEALCVSLKQQMEAFCAHYDEGKMYQLIARNPVALKETAAAMTSQLRELHKMRQTVDSFSQTIEHTNKHIESLTAQAIHNKSYHDWNIHEIIMWIKSLDQGKFEPYLPQIKHGLITSHITNGKILPELTRSDLSVPPFCIESFVIKKSLVEHFQALADHVNEQNNMVQNSHREGC